MALEQLGFNPVILLSIINHSFCTLSMILALCCPLMSKYQETKQKQDFLMSFQIMKMINLVQIFRIHKSVLLKLLLILLQILTLTTKFHYLKKLWLTQSLQLLMPHTVSLFATHLLIIPIEMILYNLFHNGQLKFIYSRKTTLMRYLPMQYLMIYKWQTQFAILIHP